MRGILLAGLFLATGAVMTLATQDVTGQEKKEREFPPFPKAVPNGPDPVFDEKVTIKFWNAQNKVFNLTRENVPTYRGSVGDKKAFRFKVGEPALQAMAPGVGSQVIDADGFVYEVIEKPGASSWALRVERKK